MSEHKTTTKQWGGASLNIPAPKTQNRNSANYKRPSAAPEERKCKVDGCDLKVIDRDGVTVFCEHHNAKNKYDHGAKIPRGMMKIISKPTYGTLDRAAMAAANIISEHMAVNGKVEYGIGIYGNEDNPRKKVYYLTETRLGNESEVDVDDTITILSSPKDPPHLPIINNKICSFKAHVHSHPLFLTYSNEFSTVDYYLACGLIMLGNTYSYDDKRNKPPYPMYLVGRETDREILTKFTPPINKVIAYKLAIVMAAVFPGNENSLSEICEKTALYLMDALNTISYSDEVTRRDGLKRQFKLYINSLGYNIKALGIRIRTELYRTKYDVIERYGGELKRMTIINENRDIEEDEWGYFVTQYNE